MTRAGPNSEALAKLKSTPDVPLKDAGTAP
jgi:hypothetical protein